ncbi:hypothetical protein [Paludisphaera rhizosphaerae]|uniref:hypothetical protein n=1 Tax=Paludisphaera rhizosphaerae TaxID=2711216 RepID=UPI0013ECDB8F|nr:hypothetical protein [Paludisphaera rhizosphaerae]
MRILAVVVLGLAVSGGPAAGASLHATAAESDGEDGGPHSCCCGTRCRGASCCCGPKKSKKPSHRESAPASPPSSGDTGPCMGAAPCGDPAVPTATFAGPAAKAAVLLRHPGLRDHRTGGRLRSAPPSLSLPARLASRLERPPRGLAPA